MVLAYFSVLLNLSLRYVATSLPVPQYNKCPDSCFLITSFSHLLLSCLDFFASLPFSSLDFRAQQNLGIPSHPYYIFLFLWRGLHTHSSQEVTDTSLLRSLSWQAKGGIWDARNTTQVHHRSDYLQGKLLIALLSLGHPTLQF